ncbi:biotin--[acetyl-CoA-carboxylase] ligase [Brevibacillus dissolubilis]|uniref:biotin--[acetyl-CoA-carboxylase] ligase n=1 Tax=Brevibacillus dissolubilis TaxID=1844116 RepID=UPI00111774CA|nr:biotin--[acetyl-CoA-carboxylase] ligase [Brevibacillus dissolubilis]
MNIKQEILKAFQQKPNDFISGEYLSQLCNVSRTAVWKHIEELREEGYEFEAVRKSGYRLVTVPDTISVEQIITGNQAKYMGQHIIAHDTVQSTQILAHQEAGNGAPEGTIVIAEMQTGGKGRLGRVWHSPKGTGIWMSLIIRPVIPLAKAPQMTLLTAVAMARTIREQLDVDVKIKWPNDIFVNGKKVCGILTELNAESDRVNYLVIGIGINVNTVESDFPEDLGEIATSLRIAYGNPIRRAPFIQAFCRTFEELYETYLRDGFASVKSEWESYSMSLGRMVTVRTVQSTVEGQAIGLDDDGVLLVEDMAGQLHKVYSADIDYRAN